MSRRYSRRRNNKNDWTKGKHDGRSRGALAQYLNPFSSSSVVPCIPDGSTAYSTGFREQSSHRLNLSTPVSYFLLLPSFISPCMHWMANAELQDWGVTDLTAANLTDPALVPIVPVSGYSVNFRNAIDQCRLVSAGVQLKCVSNAGMNDGYFEAVRIPSQNLFAERINLRDMVLSPTYIHGKIRDLEAYTFQLKPIAGHDWRAPQQFWNTSTAVTAANAVEAVTAGLNERDASFDAILIKFVPTKTAVNNVIAQPTVVHAHTVHNFEVQFDDSSIMAKFMQTPPKDLAGYERCRSKLTSNLRAGRSVYNAR